mmetsp:Transcript_13218/g.19079  ORF Transcript_13218/g.19079 Transcript_13218/m.19079 type:complete len:84 (-) Transcript_13218:1846-2097(-)
MYWIVEGDVRAKNNLYPSREVTECNDLVDVLRAEELDQGPMVAKTEYTGSESFTGTGVLEKSFILPWGYWCKSEYINTEHDVT